MNITAQLKHYIKDVLGIEIDFEIWQESNSLPFILRDTYIFYKTKMLDFAFLFFIAKNDKELTPAVINKHLFLIQDKWQNEIVYVNQVISSYNRKRLVEQKVPFIIPGNQMYLLPLAIDFRENFRKLKTVKTQLTPSAQAVLLYALYNKEQIRYTQSGLAKTLSYTHMTMNRVFDELNALAVCTIDVEAKEKDLRFAYPQKILWEKTKSYFRPPIKRKIFIKSIKNTSLLTKAGLTALSHYSRLSPPPVPVYAIDLELLKALKLQTEIIELENADIDTFELEIWTYSPRLFAKNGIVDTISLYCSLKDNNDERIESALDIMMDKLW